MSAPIVSAAFPLNLTTLHRNLVHPYAVRHANLILYLQQSTLHMSLPHRPLLRRVLLLLLVRAVLNLRPIFALPRLFQLRQLLHQPFSLISFHQRRL